MSGTAIPVKQKLSGFSKFSKKNKEEVKRNNNAEDAISDTNFKFHGKNLPYSNDEKNK